MFLPGSSLPAYNEEAGKRQLTAVELRLREVQGPAQGHTASESQGWNPGSPLLARALWTLEQRRSALMGASLSLWREGVGGGGPQGPGRERPTRGTLAPHQRCLHGSVSGKAESQLCYQLAV